MFTQNTFRNLRVDADAVLVSALTEKLADLDAHRIHATDDLVVRKAVFGLIEIVAELELRLREVESPDARARWSARLADSLGGPTPDQVRLGESAAPADRVTDEPRSPTNQVTDEQRGADQR
ncbi:hypothetical protein [Actinocorallia sp. A-T 12471]|uniref:hypothetical protein n=1 Tax=Actinocorallia sp. A-T 12471 TaxID=3089813 RepID=UPI0029CFD842|nr:hypothetical protein [Actinocorallia sp. A-T 12471]MDX6740170.1 hypothetical protein [Actinocorallia sp. A-T 12471]